MNRKADFGRSSQFFLMDNEVVYLILGLFMLYTTTHFIVIQFMKPWKARTSYERFVTIAGIVSIGLVYLSVMSNNSY